LPTTLPADGGPGLLINESHSFARVFTGCFWDLLRNLRWERPHEPGSRGRHPHRGHAPPARRRDGSRGRPVLPGRGRANRPGRRERARRPSPHGHPQRLLPRTASPGSNAMLAGPVASWTDRRRRGEDHDRSSPATRRDLKDRLRRRARAWS
jgi:hypothetical protein